MFEKDAVRERAKLSLVLFFTQGVSLHTWDRVGMLAREVALYRQLQQCGVAVTFVTYGGREDLEYAVRLPGIRICCNHWGLSRQWYARLLPWLHMRVLRHADLIKTNQARGADVAVAVARFWGKPLLVRCGYMWSKNAILEHGAGSAQARESLTVEAKAFRAADRIVVTTAEMRRDIEDRFPELAAKVSIVPNYVDTDLFAPKGRRVTGLPRLCFVGRLAPEKNLEVLIEAISGMEVELEIVGQGPLSGRLEDLARSNPRIRFLGRVANEELPGIFAECTAFVFPSLYEGHPKTPLEAMACGLPVIATNVSGIDEIIRHGETGWLCDVSAESLREGIRTVLSAPLLQDRLARNALEHVRRNFALTRIVGQELEIYRTVLASHRKRCSP